MNDKKEAGVEFAPCPMPDCGGALVGTGRLPCGVSTVSCGSCGLSVPATDEKSAVERWAELAARAPVQVAGSVDTAKLVRYDAKTAQNNGYDWGVEMWSAADGRFVEFDDVQALIDAARIASPAATVPMCERKTSAIEADGYEKTGYVLMKDDPTARICVSDGGAVSWFTREQWHWLIHNRDHVEFEWPKPIGAVSPATEADGGLDALKDAAAHHGLALVPLALNREMQRVLDDEGWHWEDLLAAADAITDEQYATIATPPATSKGEALSDDEIKREQEYFDRWPNYCQQWEAPSYALPPIALESLSTYPSPHGTLVRRADVECMLSRLAATSQPAAPAEPIAITHGYVLALQTVVKMPNGKNELGYTTLDGVGIFTSREEVSAAIAELSLPLGWVSMTTSQLLPGWMLPAAPDTSAVRDAAMEEAAEACEALVEKIGDFAVYDQRDLYPTEEERLHTASDCAAAIRALRSPPVPQQTGEVE